MSARKVYLLCAIGLSLLYWSLTPAAIAGMGYTAEEMHSGNQLLLLLSGFSTNLDIPRNGLLPVMIDLPFLAAGRALFPNPEVGQDIALSAEPCILTALLVMLVLLWTHRATADLAFSMSAAVLTGFCTMLWPYAYIGLETKQSFFLLLLAYAALEANPATRRSVMTVCIAAAFATGSKSTGAFLLPAAGYLVFKYCRRLSSQPLRRAVIAIRVATVIAVPSAIFILNAYSRSLFWAKFGGSGTFIKTWLVTDSLSPLLNLAAFFGSPNKGLWVFSPLCLLACCALPEGCRRYRSLAVFTLLTMAGLAGGFSCLRNWSDETWGPRYLHSAIAPLCILLAVVWWKTRLAPRAVAAFLIAAGTVTAGLGVLFSYTSLPIAVNQTSQNTLEGYQGDIALNHLRFNWRLMDIWLHPQHSGEWTSARQWFFEKPPDAPPPKVIDLHPFALPQPFLIRNLAVPKTGPIGRLWYILLGGLTGGLGTLAFAAVLSRKSSRAQGTHSALS